MSSLPVAMIPFANMGPLRLLALPSSCHLVSLPPRQATLALQQGRVLAAPVPVGDLPELGESVELLGPHGIAASGQVRSVLLFANARLDALTAPAHLYLTGQSSSSVRLLYLVLGQQLGFDRLPLLVDAPRLADCELRIGDQALTLNGRNGYSFATDLATEWFSSRGVPFVFARWVVRRDAPSQLARQLRAWLESFAAQEESLVAQAAEVEAERLGMRRQEMLAYLQCMRRVLTPHDLAGQEQFLRELAQHERQPLFVPAEAGSA